MSGNNQAGFLQRQAEDYTRNRGRAASRRLTGMISTDAAVGELIHLEYGEALVLVHDALRQRVGGVPLGCFLLGSRMTPGAEAEADDEETSLILMRVVGAGKLPNASEAAQWRFAAGQRALDTVETWDSRGKTDQYTLHQLRHAGLTCRVLGTWHLRRDGSDWNVRFGADIPNFYSGQGMKVYKPVGAALKRIVNYARPAGGDAHPLAGTESRIRIGRVRYAATERSDQPPEGVEVSLDPTDLLARRVAVFGMSRTGKSNTTKTIASAVFRLRARDRQRGRVGQLILDVNGEYANENVQDAGCLKAVYESTPNSSRQDVVTYGITPHPNDPGRRITKLNFFGRDPEGGQNGWLNRDALMSSLESLLVGKILVDQHYAREDAKYIKGFRSTLLEPPANLDRSSATRFRRLVSVYRSILQAAGLAPPRALANASIQGLYSNELRQALLASPVQDPAQRAEYSNAAQVLGEANPSWPRYFEALKALRRFIEDGANSGYNTFNQNYMNNPQGSGRSWHDDALMGLLGLLEYPNGVRGLRGLAVLHDPETVRDYADQITDDVIAGRLVIVDQSTGDPELTKRAAERIMTRLFERQKDRFINPIADPHNESRYLPPPDVLVYVEEAHNLLPSGSAADLTSIWSRTAKEGSKYRIGLVYATQEPSSIQQNILKNTDNWFVAHLNNADELKELKKYYDFEDFAQQILQVPEPGFLRMRTLSNAYIVPVQIDRFVARSGELQSASAGEPPANTEG